jgi:hypothetical protein
VFGWPFVLDEGRVHEESAGSSASDLEAGLVCVCLLVLVAKLLLVMKI